MHTEPQPLDGIILTPEAPDGLVNLTTAKPLDLFTTPTVITALLAAVRTEATRDFTPDLSTDKGRKAIASRAFKVARTKTFLDGIGKDEVARLKELPRQVDAGRKALRDGLDALADEIRKPLTEWEANRERLQGMVTKLRNIPSQMFNSTAAQLRRAIEDLEAQVFTEADWGDFAPEAVSTRGVVVPELRGLLEKREKWEADQVELERLRKAEEDRKQQEREEALRKEGEARAQAAAAQAAAQPTPAAPAPVPPVPTPTPVPPTQQTPPATPPPPTGKPDMEHVRACNREALADMSEALFLANIFTKDAEGRQAAETTAKALLTAIYQGKVRHVSIAY